jgi:hypothetical protein
MPAREFRFEYIRDVVFEQGTLPHAGFPEVEWPHAPS